MSAPRVGAGWITILEPTPAATFQITGFLGAYAAYSVLPEPQGASVRIAGEAFVSPKSSGYYHDCYCACGLGCLEYPTSCTVCVDYFQTGVAVRLVNRTIGFEIEIPERTDNGPERTRWSYDVPIGAGLNEIEAFATDQHGNSGWARLDISLVGPPSFVAVAAGEAASFALDGRGAIFDCGEGPLGVSRTPALYMSEGPPAVGWVELSVGRKHALAVRSDGTLWSWGGNDVGQLGVGASIQGSVAPVQVGGDADWASVAAGSDHSLLHRSPEVTHFRSCEVAQPEIGIRVLAADV